MKNEKIINSWNKIDPSDETKQKIFENVMQKSRKKNKLPRFKKILIIAAVITVVLMLTGAGVISGVIYYYETVYFDLDGNILNMNINDTDRSFLFDTGTEEYKFGEQLRESKEDNAVVFVMQEDADKVNFIYNIPTFKTIEDYDELKNYLQNHGGEAFKLPEYIPKGVDFGCAYVYIELTGDADYENFEPVYREEKFGNIYEKYILPEDKTHVTRLIVNYNKNKLSFALTVRYLGGDGEIIFGTSAGLNSEPESVDIPGFENSIIWSQKNGNLTMWGLKAKRQIDEPVEMFENLFISKIWRENQQNMYLKEYKTWEAGYVLYSIDGFSGISRDELIKIAESIK